MIDVKLSEMEKKERSESSVLADQPKYPYGLKIHVDEETYQKLGLSEIPEVGEKFMLLAVVEVCDMQQNKNLDDQMNISMGLQITEMDIKEVEKEKKDIAQSLYGSEG